MHEIMICQFYFTFYIDLSIFPIHCYISAIRCCVYRIVSLLEHGGIDTQYDLWVRKNCNNVDANSKKQKPSKPIRCIWICIRLIISKCEAQSDRFGSLKATSQTMQLQLSVDLLKCSGNFVPLYPKNRDRIYALESISHTHTATYPT